MISYRLKLVISISLLVTTSQLITGYMLTSHAEKALLERHNHEAQTMAHTLSSFSIRAFMSRDLASLYEQISLIMQEHNVLLIQIVDPENRILISNILADAGTFSNIALDPPHGISTYQTPDTGEDIAKITEPITLGKQTLGYVVLGYSHAEIRASIAQLKKKTLTTLLLGLAGALSITLILTAMITAPLRKLEETAMQIGKGQFDLSKPQENHGDAFALLDKTLYSMARRLEQMVYRDPLTGIYNRLLFNIRLQEELARSRRHNWPLAMLMVDIDHFKAINDRYGHLVGDEMLIACCQILGQHIREEDCLARFGGEEFVILAPSMTGDQALQLAERIRRAIDNEHFHPKSSTESIHMTISMGIATYPDQTKDEKDLMVLADKALYEAKYLGRNRVSLANVPSGGDTPPS